MKMTELQFEMIKENLRQLTSKDCFYKEKLKGIDVESIKSQEDFEKLPFTWKGDLREAYPLGLQAVPDEEIVQDSFFFGNNRHSGYHSLHTERCGGLGKNVCPLL